MKCRGYGNRKRVEPYCDFRTKNVKTYLRRITTYQAPSVPRTHEYALLVSHVKSLTDLLTVAFAGSTTSTFSRIVLLYGPPGTGKTTLCRGLVQKLAIRLRGHFRTVKLIELDAAALFSKFFGESSKLVYRVFETIERMLAQDPDIFICVFIDEVESLASARQQTIGGQEPKDSMRVCCTKR